MQARPACGNSRQHHHHLPVGDSMSGWRMKQLFEEQQERHEPPPPPHGNKPLPRHQQQQQRSSSSSPSKERIADSLEEMKRNMLTMQQATLSVLNEMSAAVSQMKRESSSSSSIGCGGAGGGGGVVVAAGGGGVAGPPGPAPAAASSSSLFSVTSSVPETTTTTLTRGKRTQQRAPSVTRQRSGRSFDSSTGGGCFYLPIFGGLVQSMSTGSAPRGTLITGFSRDSIDDNNNPYYYDYDDDDDDDNESLETLNSSDGLYVQFFKEKRKQQQQQQQHQCQYQYQQQQHVCSRCCKTSTTIRDILQDDDAVGRNKTAAADCCNAISVVRGTNKAAIAESETKAIVADPDSANANAAGDGAGETGGGGATAAETADAKGDDEELERSTVRLDGLEVYAVVSSLTCATSIACFEGGSTSDLAMLFAKGQYIRLVADTVFLTSGAVGIVSGIHATLVFSLMTCYGRTAIGMDRDDAFDTFFAATGLQRYRGFQTFLLSLYSFLVQVIILVAGRCPVEIGFVAFFSVFYAIYLVYKDTHTIIQSARVIFMPPPKVIVDAEEEATAGAAAAAVTAVTAAAAPAAASNDKTAATTPAAAAAAAAPTVASAASTTATTATTTTPAAAPAKADVAKPLPRMTRTGCRSLSNRGLVSAGRGMSRKSSIRMPAVPLSPPS